MSAKRIDTQNQPGEKNDSCSTKKVASPTIKAQPSSPITPTQSSSPYHIHTQIERVPPCGPSQDASRGVSPEPSYQPLQPPDVCPPVSPEIIESVLSVNGMTGHVVLRTSDIAEYSNLYFTVFRAQQAAKSAFSALDPIVYNQTTGVFSLVQTHITALGTIGIGTWGADPIAVSFGGTGVTGWEKGGLLVGTGSNSTVVLPPGINGSVLIADSTQPSGLAWGVVTGGDTYKSMVSQNDTTPEFLETKVIGTQDRVTVTKVSAGENERIVIDSPNLQYLYPADALTLEGKTLTGMPSMYSGYLSSGSTSYDPGAPAGSYVSNIITSTSFTLSSPDTSNVFNSADLGNINAVVNGSVLDSFDLAAAFNEANRVGSQDYPPSASPLNMVTITDVAWYNSFPLWQKGNAQINVGDITLLTGYNHIEMSHTGLSTDQVSASAEFFLDVGSGSPAATTPTLVPSVVYYRYLSGVQFYTNPSEFLVSSVVSNVFNNTYSANSVTFSGDAFVSGGIPYDDSSVSGVSDPPYISDVMTINDKVITVAQGVRDLNATVTIVPNKPWATGTAVTSVEQNILIDSTVPSSTNTAEYFVDEIYRMPSDSYDSIPASITGQWDSAVHLTSGQAQVYNDMLIYPVTDFSAGYLPSQTADYSAFSGDQVYYRAIYKSGYPKSNGILEVAGILSGDIGPVGSGNINIEIKLPTQTGWLDLGKPFDYGTFTGIDGDGCRVLVSGNDWSWTCGTFTTANSGWMYIMKVTIRNSSKSIQQVREIGTGWN